MLTSAGAVNAPDLVAHVGDDAPFVTGKLAERPGDPSPEASGPTAAVEGEVAKAA